jgi:tyrosine-protein kinase Etk/Wzc
MSGSSDSVELSELSAAMRYGKRYIVAGAAMGLLVAATLLVVLRPSYRGKATVLLQDFAGSGATLAGMASSEDGGALGGLSSLFSLSTGMETELEILSSRVLAGEVVDSLGLQAEVLEPHGVGTDSLFSLARFPHEWEGGRYSFEREGEGYRVSGPRFSGTAVPGRPFGLRGAEITLRARGLPDRFEVRFRGFSDAVTETLDRLDVEKKAGSVAELTFQAHDAATAAAVPNTLVRRYLARRKTVDRGVNQRRYEFLAAHTDSLSAQLARAEDALRRHQEASGVLSPEENSAAEVQQAMVLRDRLQELQVESGALSQVIADGTRGGLHARQVAAYPTLLKNPSINTALTELSTLESKRSELLERRTEQDPDVLVLDSEIRRVSNQIVTLARSFLEGTRRQEAELGAELGQSQRILAALPAEVQTSYRLERDVKRLSETLLALQTQMVQVRLAAIAEGGDVRKIDSAERPKKPTFPRPALLLALGLLGGCCLGAVAAVGQSFWSPRLRYAPQLERMSGVPVIPFQPNAPLLLGPATGARCVLVVPIGPDTDAAAVAQRLAAMSALRGENVVLADLQPEGRVPLLTPAKREGNGRGEVGDTLEVGEGDASGYRVYRAGAVATGEIPRILGELEDHSSLVVAALPPLQHPATAALLSPARPVVLVARAGKVRRSDIQSATAALPRLGVDVLGIVLQNGTHGKASG